ncbi:GntR family transcriptional regulator [Allorhizobium undicola]|uniref:GntR family transcriptional regulator n=1 Tax=Allorhizobium undicola TaxID=78527 RepID=UPI003D334283
MRFKKGDVLLCVSGTWSHFEDHAISRAQQGRNGNGAMRSGKTGQEIADALAGMIITGKMPPGERLDELSLASQFSVSRTPVREALRHLKAMRLVEHQPNRTAVVASIATAYLNAMIESLAEMEAICARFSAERMTAEERHILERLHRQSALLVHNGSDQEYALANAEFHARLYRGAHNDHISEIAMQTRRRLIPFRNQQIRHKSRLAHSYRDHGVILHAILRGDGAAAGQAAHDHITSNGDGGDATT